MTTSVATVAPKSERDEAHDAEQQIEEIKSTPTLPPPVDTSSPDLLPPVDTSSPDRLPPVDTPSLTLLPPVDTPTLALPPPVDISASKLTVDGATSLISPLPTPTTTRVEVQGNTGVDADEAPSIGAFGPNRGNQSPLLELPAELRNKIVQYALTCDEPLYLHQCADQLRLYETEEAEGTPLNQVQNVCKQLRSESQQLEWKFNVVVAPGPDFFKLVRTPNGRWESCVRKVEVVSVEGPWFDYKNPDEFVLHPLLEFCLNHKQASVRMELEDFNFDGRGGRTVVTFLNLGSVIISAIRGKGPALHSSGINMVKKWQRRKEISELNADNLRFFPRDRNFNSKKFKHFFTTIGSIRKGHMLRYYEVDNVEALMVLVEGWFETGL